MERMIDLRSDTVTRPTPEMRKAMFEAEVGDDVLREDPTVNRLEQLGADMLGKEASILVPSGTFGNQLALFSLCDRRDEVILSETSHIVQHEAGAASVISGTHLRTVMPENGYLLWNEIEPRIRKAEDVHFPRTGCIALENALSNGDVQPLEAAEEISKKAGKWNVPVHLDGARIFNAAAALGVTPETIACHADTVMFCLSKGLAAPVGSLLAGDRAVIGKARYLRKVMGGGMRQAGIIAAAGIVALETMTLRIHEDHLHAKKLGEALSRFGGIRVDPDKTRINMVFVGFTGENSREKEEHFVRLLKGKGILTYPPKYGGIRLVTHNDVTPDDLKYVISVLPEIMEKVSHL